MPNEDPQVPEDPLARYVEAGLALLALTQSKAESLLKDVSVSGEVALTQAQKAAGWLSERGRRGTEDLLDLVRREIRDQVRALGLVTKDDLDRFESRMVGHLVGGATVASSDIPPDVKD